MRAGLKDRHILLTGATRGIGRSLAIRLSAEGPRLFLSGRDVQLLAEVAEKCTEAGATSVTYLAAELSKDDEVALLLRSAREAFGSIDMLINNAGFNARKAPIAEVETEEFDNILAVNLRAPFLLMRGTHADMKAEGRGHVVNILSTVCHSDNETMGAYTAAKVALDAMTRIYRKEARPDGIRVTSIYPGGTNTDFRPKDRPDYMSPASVADAIHAVLTLPEDVVTHEFTFRPMVESNF